MDTATSPEEHERWQRITLRVEDVPLKLVVPASQETYFRKAGSDLALTAGIYRERYPQQAGMPQLSHLLMASVDIAYRSQLWQEAVETRGLTEELEDLNLRTERSWAKHRHLLDELLDAEKASQEG